MNDPSSPISGPGEPSSIVGAAFFAAGAAEIPHEIAGYRLERPLGHGGFGAVWLGTKAHADGATVQVAVKIANVSAHPFTRETKCLQALRDLSCDAPAFPRLDFVPGFLGAGTLPDGRAYLVQEFIPGGTLDIGHARTAEETEALLADLLRAVDAMHEATRQRLGFTHVHADLKPGNIVLAPDGRVVLLDFGAARKVKETGSTTGLVGTVSHGYCAPEIYAGRKPLPASDVYSIGVIGFELLTRTRLTDARQYTSKAQLHAALERCGARRPLILAVKRAMEEDAESRFPTPRAFLDFLGNPWAAALGLAADSGANATDLRQKATASLRRFRRSCFTHAAALVLAALATGWFALPWLVQALRAAGFAQLPDSHVAWPGLTTASLAWLAAALLGGRTVARRAAALTDHAKGLVAAGDYALAGNCLAAAAQAGRRKEREDRRRMLGLRDACGG